MLKAAIAERQGNQVSTTSSPVRCKMCLARKSIAVICGANRLRSSSRSLARRTFSARFSQGIAIGFLPTCTSRWSTSGPTPTGSCVTCAHNLNAGLVWLVPGNSEATHDDFSAPAADGDGLNALPACRTCFQQASAGEWPRTAPRPLASGI